MSALFSSFVLLETALPSNGVEAREVGIFATLLVLSGFYSGSESALTAVNPVKVASLARQGGRTNLVLETLIQDRAKMISALLIANNVINVAIATFATVVFSSAMLSFTGGDAALAATLAGVVSVVFLLIFGEVVPKTIGVKMPLRVSRLVAWPVYFTMLTVTPLTYLLSWLQSGVLKLLGHNSDLETAVTGEDIHTIVDLARDQEVIGHHSSFAISRLVGLHQLLVREVMTPRIDVVGLPVSASFGDAIKAFRSHQFSRLPVYDGDIDNIVGVMTNRDLLGLSDSEIASFDVRRVAREALFVPEQKPVEHLINDMRKSRTHLAIVVDEFGGTAGVVTLEDLLEEVVGQIEDEFDLETPEVRRVSATVALVDGSCSIQDFEKELGVSFGDVEGIDTVAGLVIREFGKIPVEGESLSFHSLEFTIRRMKGPRVTRIMVRLPSPSRRLQGIR
ncbi:MAG: HlyC/CorC family transporter [Planctomycetes bacterium]|nr:HlyC/CorC family transporter [Planctomycetota bacterium]